MYKFTILFTILFSSFLFSQTMNIHTTDGSVTQHNLSEIDSITFSLSNGNISYLLVDDFENYDLNTFPTSGGWLLVYNGYGTSYQIVSDSSSVSGSKSLQLEGNSNWSADVVNEFESIPSIIYFEGYVKTKKVNESVMNYDEASFGLSNKDVGTWGTNYAQVVFWNDNNIYFSSSYDEEKWVQIGTWNEGQWYKVKVKYDNINKVGSVWLDDILKTEGHDLSGPIGEYKSIRLKGGNDTHTRSWFDDVKVWYED